MQPPSWQLIRTTLREKMPPGPFQTTGKNQQLAHYDLMNLQSSMVDMPGRPHFSMRNPERLFESGMSSLRRTRLLFFVNMKHGTWAIRLKVFLRMPSIGHKSKSESSAEFKQPASNKFLGPLQGVKSDEINELIVESIDSSYYQR